MDKQQFEKSVQLFKVLGEIRLPSGRNLKEELNLGTDISLWDVIAPYLVLYRFPYFFRSSLKRSAWRQRIYQRIRPYLGVAGRMRDDFLHLPEKNSLACREWHGDGPIVLFLGFSPLFFRDVLEPVVRQLLDRSSWRIVVIGHGSRSFHDLPKNKKLSLQSIWEHWKQDTEALKQKMTLHLQESQTFFLDRNIFLSILRDQGLMLNTSALISEFKWLFRREFRRLIPQTAAAFHILQQHRPSLIVSPDDADQRCRIYSLAGRTLGIPSLIVQQGFTRPSYPDWHFF